MEMHCWKHCAGGTAISFPEYIQFSLPLYSLTGVLNLKTKAKPQKKHSSVFLVQFRRTNFH